ncbi:alpha/beta-hydrolase [Meira miltonrushii]|uniref:Carboxypeptidase n=1 Tax=Meira miltonrushii TaxID=1280837 RepID=A0A316VBH6_9BASI|nr:alpha/beta-hydrolase [Meira miltonrushii]PWN33593.1 alpha/beta-hydrolase [Meira miltonrushii]
MRLTSFAVWLSAGLTLSRAAQLPFLAEGPSESHDYTNNVDRPSTFTFSHPSFPAHTLRFVEPPGDICERHKGTRSWSGYLDVNLDELWKKEQQDAQNGNGVYAPRLMERDEEEVYANKEKHPEGVIEHFYFWAFESRNDPKEDPTVLWLNGGPGCSSGCGMLMELGPCNAQNYNGTKGPHTKYNPHSWNNNASLIFLDQPVGTGFSYASWSDPKKEGKAPSRIYTAREAARDASAFLQLWGSHAKELIGQAPSSFHIAGESYAGRWAPLIASQLIEDNKKAIAHPDLGFKPLPLASVLIGNGFTSPKHQFQAYVEYSCANTTGFGTFLPKEQCKTMWGRVPTCLALTEKCNTPTEGKPHDTLACKTALDFCETALQAPWTDTGMSPYDYEHMGDYEEDDWFATFLNATKTKKALGIDKSGAGDKHDGSYASCSDKVFSRFSKTGDGAKDSTWAVKDLLENDIRVLLYAGERDFICNYLGIQAWSLDLQWSGRDEFRKQELVPWYHPAPKQEEVAGVQRTYGNLTFLTIRESSHFVPYSQPEASLKMFNSWIHDKSPPQ